MSHGQTNDTKLRMTSRELKAAVRVLRQNIRRHRADVELNASVSTSTTTSAIARYIGSVGHEKRKPDEQSRVEYWGLSREAVRAATQMSPQLSALSLSDQLTVWAEFYHGSTSYDELAAALRWMSRKPQRAVVLKNPELIFKLQSKIDNWANSDALADLVAAYVDLHPRAGLKQLRKWNASKNPWERRQSLVGLYFYARMRKRKIRATTSLPLVKNLLRDRHYFVQKAVGWTLREIYQVDRKAQVTFVRENVAQISATAFFATAEKYTDKERAQIKKIRARPLK
jgi:3-methyladenine DNA glycosylase AlkD